MARGLWWQDWAGSAIDFHFAGFVRYMAKVNPFMPSSTIPFLAWAATVAELSLGSLWYSVSGFGGPPWAAPCRWQSLALPWPSPSESSRRWTTRRSPHPQERCFWRCIKTAKWEPNHEQFQRHERAKQRLAWVRLFASVDWMLVAAPSLIWGASFLTVSL